MMPSTSRNGIRTASVRYRSNTSGGMITFEMPVSSSSVRNTRPFAVEIEEQRLGDRRAGGRGQPVPEAVGSCASS
jgi:hypothetical protein